MKSAAENLTPTRVKLTVEVPYEELKPSIDAAYKSIGSQIAIPGFRKGHVPSRIIDQRMGKGAVLQEAVNEAMPGLYAKAIEESAVRPIGQPEVEITEVPTEEGQTLNFTAEMDVIPDFTLPDLDGIAVTVDDVEVTDEDINTQLDALRTRFGTLVPVERAVGEGDFVSIDLSATIGEEQIDEVTGVSYEVGSGNMLPGMDEALLGMTAGETKTFTAALAGGDRQGEDAECTVTVQSVKERELPELDDDFAQLASEFDSLDELKANVSEVALRGKKFEQGIQARDKILEHLLENVELEVPEGVVEAEVHAHLEGEGRLEDDEHRAEVQESTRRAMKAQFILDKLVEQDDVEVSQEEFVEYLIMQAQQYRMDPNQFAQAIDANNQVPAMVGEVARRKALAGVLDRAKITDASGNEVDLDELAPDEVEDVETVEDIDAVETGEEIESADAGEAAEEPAAKA
ncbi:Trigger factor [Nostocoides australiense Ben110]|uniref:Trigger factor n=1 Tax=Nostocoides australiense Ben110 TaxID=1193182 RepID=W6JYD3_9MICO|nr:trigger factor [Tetrasphaera australiensis]CCH74538.1 Trigger factor [Tetrasphaera australiensis Ben110]